MEIYHKLAKGKLKIWNGNFNKMYSKRKILAITFCRKCEKKLQTFLHTLFACYANKPMIQN